MMNMLMLETFNTEDELGFTIQNLRNRVEDKDPLAELERITSVSAICASC
jgi:hypothetical protein